jgi:hypothetical protein
VKVRRVIHHLAGKMAVLKGLEKVCETFHKALATFPESLFNAPSTDYHSGLRPTSPTAQPRL